MRLRRLSLPLAIGISGLAFAAPAALAHVQIKAPKQRHAAQKDGPCGEEGGTRTQNVCEFQPGATITVAVGRDHRASGSLPHQLR